MSDKNTRLPQDPVWVPYQDLGGGLNTRKDIHALNRNELAQSVNCWPSYDRAIAKRPGNSYLVTANGATGSGLAGKAMASCRFNNVTYLLILSGSTVYAAAVNGASFANIGSVSASATFITAAQMFDPTTAATTGAQDGIVFICDGFSTPQYWKGPGSTLTTVATGSNNLPTRSDGTTPITPQYVKTLGNNSHLFYSGDPTQPSSVFISDPFTPQQFTSASMISNPYGYAAGKYFPAIIGNNDGVEGGGITGMETLGGMMLIFKQAAIYRMYQTTLLGDIPVWKVEQVSNSIGNLSPRSLVRFDTFVTFLGIDGVYMTDGSSVQEISSDVPTLFDSSLNGQVAAITNRTSAIGVRQANKLLLFFETQSAGYCNSGVWFDFTRQSASNLPVAGLINGMNVAGAVSLRGPNDDGNVAWCDAVLDRVAKFGIGFSDFGNAIQVNFATRGDIMDDVFGPDAPLCIKQAQDVYGLVQLVGTSNNINVNFTGVLVTDLINSYTQSYPTTIVSPVLGGQWGSGTWGSLVWGSSVNNAEYFIVKFPAQQNAQGRMLQVAIQEASTAPWVFFGLIMRVNKQEVSL